MKQTWKYFEELTKVIKQVQETQYKIIDEVVERIAQSMKNGGTLYTFGTGHSHLLALEIFYRAGGLVKVHPLLDEPIMLHTGAFRSSQMERLSGYAKTILDEVKQIKKGDVIFIFSNSGRNVVPIEMAIEAKKRGMVTVCITNLNHSTSTTSRHSSGKRLFEICDFVIDNCGQVGDASIEIGEYKCGPTSTAVGATILQAIVCGVVERATEIGSNVEVFYSNNVDGGDEFNSKYVEKYKGIIPRL